MTPISLAIVGSTKRTTLLAEALRQQSDFQIDWILTPTPKPIGRDQQLTRNPLHEWGISNQLPIVTVEKKIDDEVKRLIVAQKQPQVLLVVDFGYLIPDWLLEWPTVAPINVHPSALPSWRGGSPGQFVLLAGEQISAVSVIVVTTGLDSGPLIAQLPFAVNHSWTQTEYYEYSFTIITNQLPTILRQFAAEPHRLTVQPATSPTPIARRLAKTDSFVPWSVFKAAVVANTSLTAIELAIPLEIANQPVLQTLLKMYPAAHHALILEHACRAFSPWPLLWTEVPTHKGTKKMQVLACTVTNQGSLQLETVKIEGLPAKPWREVKNQLKE